MQTRPNSGEIYRHFKNKLYQIITIAKHSETGEELVIYQALYGDFRTYARPLAMFLSEVDHEKYPTAAQKYRFEKVERDNLERAAAVPEHSLLQQHPEPQQEEEPQKQVVEQMQGRERPQETEQQPGADPKLIAFLDTDTYAQKYKLVTEMHGEITDRLINDLSVVLDIVIDEGPLDKRYEQLRTALATFAKFEVNRLR